MSRIAALVIAGGLVLGAASSARAQFSMSIGNGYNNGYNNGYGYGNNAFVGLGGYGNYANPYGNFRNPGVLTATSYSSYYGVPGAYGLGPVAAPAATYYNSGYYGVAPAVGVVPVGYGVRPYGYGGYGYGRPYGYGYNRPFGGLFRRY